MSVAIFVVILAVVAGLVAAGGDRMGHRAARRKIRIGKMRPRNVSTLIAVITGIVISLATFGVVFALWEDFRGALTNYNQVKKDLKSSIAELDSMQADLDRAQREIADADDKVAAAEAEAETLNEQLSGMREQTFELAKAIDIQQQELDAKEKQVAGLENTVARLKSTSAELQKEIDGDNIQLAHLQELKRIIAADIESLEEQIESYQEGEIILRRGTALAYQRIQLDDRDNLPGILQGALNRVNVNLSKEGLSIAEETETKALAFLNTVDLTGADQFVIVISVGKNAFEGESVSLEFGSLPLVNLVQPGDVVLEVKVEQLEAQISSLGGSPAVVSIPGHLTIDSLVDLSVKMHNELQLAARATGFLPNLRSGQVETPVGLIEEVADNLLEYERPFLIQFTATRALTALDGLGDAEISVLGTKPEPRPDESAAGGEPSAGGAE